jgi:hypothetical protein
VKALILLPHLSLSGDKKPGFPRRIGGKSAENQE